MSAHQDNQPEDIESAIAFLMSLSKPPMPLAEQPPWQRMRDNLPAGCELPTESVHVLVDMTIDADGLVTHARVGTPPKLPPNVQVVHGCEGPDGVMHYAPDPVPASVEIANAVAAAFVGERFTPAERNGLRVTVPCLRMGIGIRPSQLGAPS